MSTQHNATQHDNAYDTSKQHSPIQHNDTQSEVEFFTNDGDNAENADGDAACALEQDNDKQVGPCFCQANPQNIPQNFTPCCLPRGSLLSKREIQMFPEFKGNLLQTMGEPAKTQTIRNWGMQRLRAHKLSFLAGEWIRVWRGQGHKDTIGWLLITSWENVMVSEIDHDDCVREGLPEWKPEEFRKKYCKGLAPNHKLVRIRFNFRSCRACL